MLVVQFSMSFAFAFPRQPVYYITTHPLCQYLFLSFFEVFLSFFAKTTSCILCTFTTLNADSAGGARGALSPAEAVKTSASGGFWAKILERRFFEMFLVWVLCVGVLQRFCVAYPPRKNHFSLFTVHFFIDSLVRTISNAEVSSCLLRHFISLANATDEESRLAF